MHRMHAVRAPRNVLDQTMGTWSIFWSMLRIATFYRFMDAC